MRGFKLFCLAKYSGLVYCIVYIRKQNTDLTIQGVLHVNIYTSCYYGKCLVKHSRRGSNDDQAEERNEKAWSKPKAKEKTIHLSYQIKKMLTVFCLCLERHGCNILYGSSIKRLFSASKYRYIDIRAFRILEFGITDLYVVIVIRLTIKISPSKLHR